MPIDGELLRQIWDDSKPDGQGRVSRAEVFATFRARTGINLGTAGATTTVTPVGKSEDSVGRQPSIRSAWDVSDEGRASMSLAAGTEATIAESHTSANEAAGKTGTYCRQEEDGIDSLIDFDGFAASVERAMDPRATNHDILFVQVGEERGGSRGAEARTPPAMERNLFLSALANGRLAVREGQEGKRRGGGTAFPWLLYMPLSSH